MGESPHGLWDPGRKSEEAHTKDAGREVDAARETDLTGAAPAVDVRELRTVTRGMGRSLCVVYTCRKENLCLGL